MSRRWLLSLLCLAVLFLSLVQFTRARDELRVNESSSRILLEKAPAEVLLAVENPSTADVNANVQLELLDPRNKSIATTTQVQPIARGSQTLRLSLPFTFPGADEKNVIAYFGIDCTTGSVLRNLPLKHSPTESSPCPS